MSIILVTGGLGYIGSHTSVCLIKNGYDVLIIDSLKNSSEDTLMKIKKTLEKLSPMSQNLGRLFFRKGDIRDTKWLDNIFGEFQKKNEKISSVIHFAGLKSVEESTKKPIKYWKENLEITTSLISIMKRYRCHKIVFSSSAMVYKPQEHKKVKENTQLSPINPYGNSKLAIENFLKDIHKYESPEWRIANLRYFNPVGANEFGILGENPKGKANNLFPIIGEVLNKKLSKLSIYGKDWPTKDGTCVRDFIHIEDLANAHLATLNYLTKKEAQIIDLNIGTGKGTSVLELIQTFEKVNNINLNYEFVKRREGDIPYLVADNKKSILLLNWEPQKNLEDMCKDFWNYISKS